MNKSDKQLLTQMIEAGRFNWGIYKLLGEKIKFDSAKMIKDMGSNWVCHPDNFVKKLDVPLPAISRENKLIARMKKK